MPNFVTSYLSQINSARTNPKQFAQKYRTQIFSKFNDQILNCFGKKIDTFQGSGIVQDFYEFIFRKDAVPHLHLQQNLSVLAQSIAQQKGSSGKVDHELAINIIQKLSSKVQVQGKIAQLIGLGVDSGQQAATYFLLDDGVATRRRRRILLNQNYKYIGIGYAYHRIYGNICVILLAQKIIDLQSRSNKMI